MRIERAPSPSMGCRTGDREAKGGVKSTAGIAAACRTEIMAFDSRVFAVFEALRGVYKITYTLGFC